MTQLTLNILATLAALFSPVAFGYKAGVINDMHVDLNYKASF